MFEYIYFARPDSRMNDQVLQVARGRMGEILWREAPVEADLVIAVPDSGNPAARGLARAAGLPQDDGFVKNRYVARTFIQPGQELRKHGLRLKFNPLPEVIAGKRLVVVDDSIVRGNTTRQIVQMLRDAGAAEIHMRISAPPIKHPCHYGIDMSTREEMIAHERTTEQVAQELGCDSLHYLSLEGVYEAVGATQRDALRRLLHRPLPARGQRRRGRQVLARAGARRAARERLTSHPPDLTTGRPAAYPGHSVRPNRSIPAPTVIPVLIYPEVRDAVDWLTAAFGFAERLQIGENHRSQMNVGDGAVIIGDVRGDRRPPRDGEVTHSVVVRVEDVDTHLERARAHGAVIIEEITEFPFGERQYTAQDPAGHQWTFSQTIADTDPQDWGGIPVSL